MLALLGLLSPIAAGAAELSDLVRRCERVEIGRVDESRVIEGIGDVRIAELQVETSLWSFPCLDRIDLLDPTHPEIGRPSVIQGERAVWFLAPSTLSRNEFDRSTLWQLLQIRHGVGLQDVVGCLRLERRDQRDLVVLPWPVSALPPDLRTTARQGPGSDRPVCVPFETFEIWLRREIVVDTPRIEAQIVSNGPCNIALEIGPDGKGRIQDCHGEARLILVPSTMQRLVATIEREDFYSLPESLGHAPGPDSSTGGVRVRTSRGTYSISIHGPADRRSDSPEQIEALARAMRVWDALPHDGRWRITGP